MVTMKEIVARAEKIEIPIAHNEFIETKKTPLPEPPYLVWLTKEKRRGSDDRNRLKEVSGSIELYTEQRGESEIEKKIEEDVLCDVEFEKSQVFIKAENILLTAYDFEMLEKI